MKKNVCSLLLIFFAFSLFAYNPPSGGQKIPNLSSPTALTSASSSAGGAIFMPGSESISFNPALTALEQRIQLDAAFTFLGSTNSDEDFFHSAMQAGILIPTKRFVFAGELYGIFCKTVEMDLGDIICLRTGLSKEVTDKLSVGANLNGGVMWGEGTDWSLGLDVGALYKTQIKKYDFRVGGAILNLGKYYCGDNLGIKTGYESDAFPSICTIKCGAASTFIENKNIKIGASLDFSTPLFQNFIVDLGVQCSVKDLVFISVAESIDVTEEAYKCNGYVPAISVGVKFNFSTKNNQYLESHNWDQNEMLVSAAWQQKYEKIQAASFGARLYLGQKDTTPPVIQIWDNE